MIAGTSNLFLNMDKKQMDYVDIRSRNTFLWEICNQYNITVQIEKVWTPTVQRVGDSTIMDFLINKQVSQDCLQVVNKCRLYLQVIYLSDIISADGKTVMRWAMEPPENINRNSNLKWPHQSRPKASEWYKWKYTLLSQLGITTDYNNTWKLHNKLGNWYSTPSHRP